MDISGFKKKLGYDFHFEVADPYLKDNPEVKKYLAEAEKIIKTEMITKHNETINSFINSPFCSESLKKLLTAN